MYIHTSDITEHNIQSMQVFHVIEPLDEHQLYQTKINEKTFPVAQLIKALSQNNKNIYIITSMINDNLINLINENYVANSTSLIEYKTNEIAIDQETIEALIETSEIPKIKSFMENILNDFMNKQPKKMGANEQNAFNDLVEFTKELGKAMKNNEKIDSKIIDNDINRHLSEMAKFIPNNNENSKILNEVIKTTKNISKQLTSQRVVQDGYIPIINKSFISKFYNPITIIILIIMSIIGLIAIIYAAFIFLQTYLNNQETNSDMKSNHNNNQSIELTSDNNQIIHN